MIHEKDLDECRTHGKPTADKASRCDECMDAIERAAQRAARRKRAKELLESPR